MRLNVYWVVLLVAVVVAPFRAAAQVGESNSDPQQLAIKVANEVAVLNAAALMYYRDNNEWPTDLQSLANESGYVTGSLRSSSGSPLTGTRSGDNFTVSVSVEPLIAAQLVVQQLANASLSGGIVSATFKPPYASDAYDAYLQRRANPDDPARMRLETAISFGGDNSITNAKMVGSDEFDVQDVDTESFETEELTVDDQVTVGSSEINETSTGLSIVSPATEITGTVSTSGDVNLTDDDIRNVAKLYANEITSTTANVATGNIDRVVGDYLEYTTGQVDSISGQGMNFSTGDVGVLTGNTAIAGSAVGDQLSANDAIIESLISDNVISRAVAAQNIDTVALSVTGLANIAEGIIGLVDVDTATVSRLFSDAIESVNVTANSSVGSSLTVTNRGYFNNLVTSILDADVLDATNGEANSGEAQTLSADDLKAASAVLRELVTGVLVSANSKLGNATAGEVAVQNLLSAAGVNASTGSFGTTDIDGSLSGNRATFQRAVGGRYDGGRFEGDDFHISSTSENEIFHDISSLKGKLYNCKYVTEYCYPKAPEIAQTTCPDCIIFQTSGNFSARAYATVRKCQHGCDYFWQLGDVSGSCSAGSIAEGGQRAVSCPVSGSLAEGERRLTYIDLIAVNNHDPAKRTTHRFGIDWERQEVVDPFESVKVGCFIDTAGFDEATYGGCSVPSSSDPNWQKAISWSAGDLLNGNYYFSSGTSATVVWSGDCTGTGSLCQISGYTAPANFTATAKVTINGETRSFSITAYDRRNASGPN